MTSRVNGPGRPPPSLKTLRRGLDVLSLFSERPSWTQSEISQATGLPMPTVYRLCSTLVEAGYLERAPMGNHLRCGLSVVGLASTTLSSLTPLELVLEHLRAFAGLTGETANVAVLAGGDVLYLGSAPGERLLRPQVAAGSRAPAYCTAVGKCLLAELDPSEARAVVGPEPYPARTEHTLTSWRELSAELDGIRRTGLADSNQEYELGLYSLAISIPAVEPGRPAGISVSPPTSRATREDRRFLGGELRRAAEAIDLALKLIGN